jgi:curved DNA-binding protein CbpA
MARIHTHYDNLKVARDAPPEVIRAAYKTLSQKHHPDRNGNSPDAIRIIQLINSAYDVLSDPVKRKEHDEWIARSEANSSGRDDVHLHFPSTPIYKRTSSRRSRRRPFFSTRSSRHNPVVKLVKAFQNAGMMLDDFCRKLFRKT